MADSEDEYDRKRRDKFRGERSSGDSYRSDRRDDRRREDWTERNPFRNTRVRNEYREYRGPRDKYSPGREFPPAKRMRPDWGEDIRPATRHTGYDPYLLHNWSHEHYANRGMPAYPMASNMHMRDLPTPASDLPTQPAMLTLKQFLDTQEDNICEADVFRKYNEYKLDFKRQQLNEFFVTHKDEEWFKNKYHPADSVKRKQDQISFLMKRLEVFNEELKNKTFDGIVLDSTRSEEILRLLDTIVIKLEGGTDEDLKVLDEPLPPIKYSSVTREDSVDRNDVIITEVKEKPEVYSSPKRTSPTFNTEANEDEENWDEDEPADEPRVEEEPQTEKKRSRSASVDSSSSSNTEAPSSVKSDSPVIEKQENDKEQISESIENPPSPQSKAADDLEKSVDGDVEMSEVKPEESTAEKASEEPGEVQIEENEAEKVKTPPLQYLHRTSSIFLRNLAPAITKAEIEAVCHRFDGFLRVAIADPLAERRWFRRGWVTFKRDVNIKEICWNLNNTRLRDCEIGAIVNRDLSRRVRPVNGITAHKTVVRSDIKFCAKIILNLDEKFKLWNEQHKSETETGNGYGFASNNPLMENITDYLIEEASAEEEELLGITSENRESSEGEGLERDPVIISVLDKLILYLRIVHSIDFYNHCEYPYEDEMPNRCGIIHARGPPLQSKITSNDCQDYIKNFESKIQPFLTKPQQIDIEELKNLGLKDADMEVEKFVQANTQELAKDKWLCPLSGKKFKGPEFIRKHIFNKHNDKIEEVLKEVEYFNNYLKDPKRPQLPEFAANTKRPNTEPANPMAGYRHGGYMAGSYPPYNAYAPPLLIAPRGRGFVGGRRELPLEHQRRIVGYHDLDAPTNFDVFD